MSEWEKCEDRLPRPWHWTECASNFVLVRLSSGIELEAQYDHTAGKWRDRDLYFVAAVKEWRPLDD